MLLVVTLHVYSAFLDFSSAHEEYKKDERRLLRWLRALLWTTVLELESLSLHVALAPTLVTAPL